MHANKILQGEKNHQETMNCCPEKKNIKAIRFVNSVCTIFSFWKQGPPHQTFPTKPELISAVGLWKQGPYADPVYKTNELKNILFQMKPQVKKYQNLIVFLNICHLHGIS